MMVVIGWTVTIATAFYAAWLALAFFVAVPPLEYFLTRMALVCVAFTGGSYLRNMRPG
jgi:hypothetical protein